MKKRRSRRRLRKKRHRSRRSRRRAGRRRSRRRRSRKRRRGAGFNNTKTDQRSNVKTNDCAEEKRIIRELRKQLARPSGGTPKSPPREQNPFADEYIGSPATPIRPHAARRLF